jgi:hypothetical protein
LEESEGTYHLLPTVADRRHNHLIGTTGRKNRKDHHFPDPFRGRIPHLLADG